MIQFDYCQGDAALAALYRKADLFVSTSIEDAGPMMVGEALMCGVPVVAFDVGIATELVEEGRNGFIVDRLDVRQMAARILSVYRAQAPDLEQPGVIHERAARVFSHLHWADRVSDLISAEI
nr:glycosyltransferase [Pseudomonas sp. BIGb0427]